MSPRTGQMKKFELEQWITKEKEEIKKTKTNFVQQWKKTTEIIK
jgi:hypothetical protein